MRWSWIQHLNQGYIIDSMPWFHFSISIGSVYKRRREREFDRTCCQDGDGKDQDIGVEMGNGSNIGFKKRF